MLTRRFLAAFLILVVAPIYSVQGEDSLREINAEESDPVQRSLRAGLEERRVAVLHPDDPNYGRISREIFRRMAGGRQEDLRIAFDRKLAGYLRGLPSGTSVLLAPIPQTVEQRKALEDLGFRPLIGTGELKLKLNPQFLKVLSITGQVITLELKSPLTVSPLPPLRVIRIVPSELVETRLFNSASFSDSFKRALSQESDHPEKFFGQVHEAFEKGLLSFVDVPYLFLDTQARDLFVQRLKGVSGKEGMPPLSVKLCTLPKAQRIIRYETGRRFQVEEGRLLAELSDEKNPQGQLVRVGRSDKLRRELEKKLDDRVAALVRPDQGAEAAVRRLLQELAPQELVLNFFHPGGDPNEARKKIHAHLVSADQEISQKIQDLPERGSPLARYLDRVSPLSQSQVGETWRQLEDGLGKVIMAIAESKERPEPKALEKLVGLIQRVQGVLQRDEPQDPSLRDLLRRWQADATALFAGFGRLDHPMRRAILESFLADSSSMERSFWAIFYLYSKTRISFWSSTEETKSWSKLFYLLASTSRPERYWSDQHLLEETQNLLPPSMPDPDKRSFLISYQETCRRMGEVPLALKLDLLAGRPAAFQNLMGVIGLIFAGALEASQPHVLNQHGLPKSVVEAINGFEKSTQLDARYPLWKPIFIAGPFEEKLLGYLSMLILDLQSKNWRHIDESISVGSTLFLPLFQRIQDETIPVLSHWVHKSLSEVAFRIGEALQERAAPPEFHASLHQIQAIAIRCLACTNSLSENGDPMDHSRKAIEYFVSDPAAYTGDVWSYLQQFWIARFVRPPRAGTYREKELGPEAQRVLKRSSAFYFLLLLADSSQSYSRIDFGSDARGRRSIQIHDMLLAKSPQSGDPTTLTPQYVGDCFDSILGELGRRIPGEYKIRALLGDEAVQECLFVVEASLAGMVAARLGLRELSESVQRNLQIRLKELHAAHQGIPPWSPWPEDQAGLEDALQAGFEEAVVATQL